MINLQGALYDAFDASASETVEFLVRLARSYDLPSDLTILDIGCGTGKHIPEFAQNGWQVTGIEPDADFLEMAHQRTRHLGHIQLRRGGFLDVCDKNRFDLATAINDPLAYILDFDLREEAIRRINHALKPGGVFFIEMTNFLYKLHHEQPPVVQEVKHVDQKQVVHSMRYDVNYHRGLWIHHDEYAIEGQPESIKKEHVLAITSPAEIYHHLQKQGFINIRTYSSYADTTSCELTGKLMLFSAQKPQLNSDADSNT